MERIVRRMAEVLEGKRRKPSRVTQDCPTMRSIIGVASGITYGNLKKVLRHSQQDQVARTLGSTPPESLGMGAALVQKDRANEDS